jgi:uncharacterized cupin superfamily protein
LVVVNAREASWEHDRLRSRIRFGGEGKAHFDEVGVAMYWLESGQAMSLYHHEAGQEDFLVLRGEPLLIVEEVERGLRLWDLVHCPPRTPHAIVNPSAEPALIFALGARRERGSARYPHSAAARARGVERAGNSDRADAAYADLAPPRPGPAPPLGVSPPD